MNGEKGLRITQYIYCHGLPILKCVIRGNKFRKTALLFNK